MTEKEKITRSIRASKFLDDKFWIEDLQPWIEKEKSRLEREFIGYPLEDKFDKDRERAKTRHTACDIIPGVINIWRREKEEIKRNKELKEADNLMQGAK